MGGKPRKQDACHRMTDDELREFVLAWCDGRVFSDRQVPESLLRMVFMPLGFMDLSGLDVSNIRLIWEFT